MVSDCAVIYYLSTSCFMQFWRACVLSRVLLFVTPRTIARQAPLFMGFPRQEYWSGLPCPPAGNLPDSGIEPASLTSPAWASRFFTTSEAQPYRIFLQNFIDYKTLLQVSLWCSQHSCKVGIILCVLQMGKRNRIVRISTQVPLVISDKIWL